MIRKSPEQHLDTYLSFNAQPGYKAWGAILFRSTICLEDNRGTLLVLQYIDDILYSIVFNFCIHISADNGRLPTEITSTDCDRPCSDPMHLWPAKSTNLFTVDHIWDKMIRQFKLPYYHVCLNNISREFVKKSCRMTIC